MGNPATPDTRRSTACLLVPHAPFAISGAGVDEDDDRFGDQLRVVAEPVLDGQGGAKFGSSPVVVAKAAVKGEIYEPSGGVVVVVRNVGGPPSWRSSCRAVLTAGGLARRTPCSPAASTSG